MNKRILVVLNNLTAKRKWFRQKLFQNLQKVFEKHGFALKKEYIFMLSRLNFVIISWEIELI
jgi:hypothetical protein